jgi:hypothetical protein
MKMRHMKIAVSGLLDEVDEDPALRQRFAVGFASD